MKKFLYVVTVISFVGTANAMYRQTINRLSTPLITSARNIRGSAGYMPKNCNINQSQRSFNIPSFGNRQFNQSSGKSASWAAGLAGAGLGLGAGYYLAQDKPVLAEEQKSIFSTKEGPVNPIYREPIIEKPINQPDAYVLSQFIPKASLERTRLLNQTYNDGQMVIDDTGDKYHVFITDPYRFFNVYPDHKLKFYVYKEGTGVLIKGDGTNGDIQFPVPLAKEILSTQEKPNYITPISHPDGTLELILKKDTSYNDNLLNRLRSYWNKGQVSYWAPNRPRDPRKPISGPWWAL